MTITKEMVLRWLKEAKSLRVREEIKKRYHYILYGVKEKGESHEQMSSM